MAHQRRSKSGGNVEICPSIFERVHKGLNPGQAVRFFSLFYSDIHETRV